MTRTVVVLPAPSGPISPQVDPRKYFVYYDPLDRLPDAGRKRWADPAEHRRMLKEAVLAAGLTGYEPALPV